MSAESEKLAEGTLISHLLELRDRLLRAVIAVAIVFVPCAYYANEIFTFVANPLKAQLPPGSSLMATQITASFTVPFKLSFFVALFIAMPYVLYQVWSFVAPGLYKHEKRFALPLLLSSILLFYVGIGFAYQFVFPVIFKFFTTTGPEALKVMPDIGQFLDFALTMFFAFGIAFEVPIAVVLLAITGIVEIDTLKKARGYVLIGIFVIAAILTPPDAVSQCIMGVPMYFLFEGGLIMAGILKKMRRKHQEEEEAREKADAQSDA
jgi:sec-independent protein translocase protein TatC